MSSKPAGNAALGAVRKTWDKEAFEKRARERVERELEEEREAAKAKAPPRVVVQRAPLDREKARADQNLNISGEVGKKTVINTKQPELGKSPFFCTVCNCELRDSANWLAHLNGKNHVRNLGMNMRAERSTVEGVKSKLASTRAQTAAPVSRDEAAARFRAEFDERVRQQDEVARLERQQKRAAERERKKQQGDPGGRTADPAADGDDGAAAADPMMAAMGFDFGSFGSSKQKR